MSPKLVLKWLAGQRDGMTPDRKIMEEQAVTIDEQQNEAAKRWAIRGVLKFAFVASAVAVGVYIGLSLA